MRSLLVCAAIAAAVGSLAAQDEKKSKNDKPVIVVTGCVERSWLRAQTVDRSGTYVERYRLHGTKQLMKEFEKTYDGHLVEVTGAVTDTGNTTHKGKVIPVGKNTRIYTGAKEGPQIPTGSGDPILEVASFREIKNRCR